MTYLGTFWLGVLCGTLGGSLGTVGVWLLVRKYVRIETVWRGWSQTQGDE